MIFCASASGSVVADEASGAAAGSGVGATGADAGVTGAGASTGVRSREIGGRTAARLTAPSPSGRFGFGFFSSINETVSTFRGGAAGGGAAGLVCGAGLAGDSRRGLVVIGMWALIGGAGADFSLPAAGGGVAGFAGSGLVVFAGAAAGLEDLVSLRFGSACAAFDDDALLAAGFLGAGAAVLRAAVFVVVFVAIVKF